MKLRKGQIRWEKVWVSVPESRYVQTVEDAELLADLLDHTRAEVLRIAKRKREAVGST